MNKTLKCLLMNDLENMERDLKSLSIFVTENVSNRSYEKSTINQSLDLQIEKIKKIKYLCNLHTEIYEKK